MRGRSRSAAFLPAAFPACVFFSLAALRLCAAPLFISEIMYHDADPVFSLEFVEIHNAGGEAAELSGWRLEGAVRYAFPEGTVIGAGDYLVVAEDPEDIFVQYGVEALGPYRGRLNNGGETLVLFDSAGTEVDRVDYDDTWPWPVVADGGGPSLERIDFEPAAGDDPSVWSPAENADAWRLVERVGHATSTGYRLWLTAAGECLIDDVELTPLDAPWENLVRNGTFDEDAASWRGFGGHRSSKWESEEGYEAPGSFRIVSKGAGSQSSSAVTFSMSSNPTPWGLYRLRFRVKPVSGACELEGAFLGGGTPLKVPLSGIGTPGKPNSAARPGRPPVLLSRRIFPAEPTSGDAVELRAEFANPETIREVVLHYRLNFGREKEETVTGEGGGRWRVEIPPARSKTAVRYRFTVKTETEEFSFPRPDDPTPYYGYFVYDGEDESPLPFVWLFIGGPELSRLNADIWSRNYVRGTIVFGREVYDCVRD